MKRNKPDTHQSKEIKRIKSIDNDLKEGNSNDDKTNCGVSSVGHGNKNPGFGFGPDSNKYYNPCKTSTAYKFMDGKSKANSRHRKTMRSKHNKNILVVEKVLPQKIPKELDTSLETDTLDLSTDRVITHEVDITRKQFSATYPPSKKFSLDDIDLEMDIIEAKKIKEKQLQQAPENVDTAYSDMKPKKINDPLIACSCVPVDILVTKTKPIGESYVQIQHLVNETLLLDDFGAELKTYKTHTPDGHQYYRHIFKDVLPNSPAKEMKLREECEIVLLNGVFVPDLDHNEVLKLFIDVKVDGLTRFELVVRYVDKVEQKKTWVWFETSAVLDDSTPDHERGHSYPTVEDERYEVLPDKQTEIKMICRLRIKGTRWFIVIGSDSVSFSLKPSTLRVNGRYKQDESGNVTFTATICDMDENNYIALSENTVTIIHTPYWFGMQQTGSNFVFRSDGKFLVYDMRRNMLSTSNTEANKYCQFEKITLDDGLDEIDAAVLTSSSHLCCDKQDEPDNHEHATGDDKTVQGTVPKMLSLEAENFVAPSQMSEASSRRSLFQSSSKRSSFISGSQESSFELSSQESSFDETRFANNVPMTSSSRRSSGYLTSGSFELDLKLEDKPKTPKTPKTPNTPMACLNIGDKIVDNVSTLKTVIW
ncbi:hypothetical protein ACF0H5_020689 [Mactra antiquata]